MNVNELIEQFKKPGERDRKELGLLFHGKRFLSYYMAIPFVPLPLTPNQITVLSNLVQFIGIVLIAVWPGHLRLLGLFIFYLGDILDFVDGNIARFRNQCSTTGVFLDQLGHVIIAPCFFATIGIAALRDSGEAYFIYLAVLLGITPAIVSFQLVALRQFIADEQDRQGSSEIEKNATLPRKIIRKFISSLFHYKAELLLLAILTNHLPELALLFAIYFPIRICLQLFLDLKTLGRAS